MTRTAVSVETFDMGIAVNLRHQFFAAQAVAPDMRALGGGSIINLGSISWMIKEGGMPVYTTSKAAIQGLTRSLARDLGPHGIRVNTLVPGWVMTEKQLRLWVDEAGIRRIEESNACEAAGTGGHRADGAIPRGRRQPDVHGPGLHRRRRLDLARDPVRAQLSTENRFPIAERCIAAAAAHAPPGGFPH